MVRGFNAYTYRDGLLIGANFGGIREEPYAYDRIEVLKGANSTGFGISDPGGSVNYISKLPKTGRWGGRSIPPSDPSRKKKSALISVMI